MQILGDSKSLSRALGRASKDLSGLNLAGSRFGRAFGTVVRAGGIAAAAGLGAFTFGAIKAVKSAGDFQQQLNVLQAVSGATASQMSRISAESIRLGKDVQLPATSAQDAALAMTELTKAGLSVKDAMSAARGTLQLAAAAETDAGTAATIAATALNQFHLQGKEAGYVADLLAGAANASAGDIADFAEGLQYAGTAAHAAGQKITLTIAALAEMANAGLQGSVAGSSLAQALRSLQAPSAKAEDAIKKFGLSIYDAHGNMKPLDEIAQTFTTHLGDLTQKNQNATLATIFGSRAVQAARIVFLGGADALDKYALKVNESGSAQRLAAARMKGFSGAVQAFQSNVETLGIQIGLILIPAATTAARELSGLVDVISQIAGAKSPSIAIHIAWRGVGKLYDSLRAALFGELKDAPSKLAGAHRGVEIPVRTTGLVGGALAALKSVDWKSIGLAIAAGISAGLTFTAAQMNNLVSSLTAALLANSDQIANAGAIIATKLLLTLTDPGFWASHWELAIAVAIAVAPTRFLKLGRFLGKVIGESLLKAADEVFAHLPTMIRAQIMVAIGEASGWGSRLGFRFLLAANAVFDRIPGVLQRIFLGAIRLIADSMKILFGGIREDGVKAVQALGNKIGSSLIGRTVIWLGKVTAVLGVFNAIKSTVQWLIDHIPDIPSFPSLPSLPSLPKFPHGASGAIVTRPTLALIGEKTAEAVIPLNRTPGSAPLPGWNSRGGGDVNFYFSGLLIDGPGVKKAVNVIMPEIRRQQARAG